jgi:AraC-like DNA-binding protein
MARSDTFHAYQHIPRAVSMIIVEHEPSPGVIVPAHSHPRAQLAYAVEGMFSLHAPNGVWLVPPNRAVWIPGGVEHEMRARGQAVSNRSLYIQPDAAPELPTNCRVIGVSPLLRQLMIEAQQIPLLYDEAGRDGRIMRLILDEICTAPELPLRVPMPSDPRLLRICALLLEAPGTEGDLSHWARVGALSRRTLTRLFRQETGMTFASWRQHVRLMEAMARLAGGASIAAVSHDLGYGCQSAFTAMFRRVMGKPPRAYLGKVER